MRKILVVLILLLSVNIFAENDDGYGLLMLGESAGSLGKGGTGVTDEEVDMFFMNPASIGSIERVGVSLQYGDLYPEYYNPNAIVAFPTSYGNFGVGLKMIQIDDPENISKAYYGTIGAAKEISDYLIAGISFNILIGDDEEGSIFYGGLGLGMIYMLPFNKATKSGFGFYDAKIAFGLNAGIPLDDDTGNANMNNLTLGYSFNFFKNHLLSVGLYNDFSAIDWYQKYPIKVGLETIIKESFIMSAGAIYPGDSYNYGGFTGGLGYILSHDQFKMRINTSVVYHNDNGFVYYAGITSEIGKLDRTPPETKVETDNKYISPNHDGTQDFVMIDLSVNDRSKIEGWSLKVLDENNNVIREYRVSERDMKKSLTPKEFVKNVFKKKESMVVPEKILWDGTDSSGNTVSDGNYKYNFMAWDERDNYSIKKSGEIVVDNTSPEAAVKTDYLLFSPNNDRKKDVLVIDQNIKSSNDDVWEAGFKDSEGKVVKKYSWSGKNIPRKVEWDGKDDAGNDVEEGLYQYFIASADEAGNKEEKLIKEITLTRKYQSIDVFVDSEYFSRKLKDKIVFTASVSDTKGLENWKLEITDEKEKEVKVISGTNSIPQKIEWDAKDDKGNDVKDSVYYYKLTAVYSSGNTPETFRKSFICDETAPKLDIDISPNLFSPDNDGENDMLQIDASAKEEFEIDSWQIVIYNPTKFKFKEFSGKGNPPEMLKWDGLSDKNELVESATDYKMNFIVKDKAGNVAKVENVKIPVDILVIVTDRGLKIKISNIEFAFGSARIVGNGYSILKRVAQILKKYENYNIVVEGHTDDIGKEEYNLKLSEGRAKAVYNYLIKKGISKKRLTFRGMGETMPFVENIDNESRRKNRRVEFLLVKPGEDEKNITGDVTGDK